MLGLFLMIVFILLLIAGITGLVFASTDDGKGAGLVGAVVGLVGFIIAFTLSCFTMIPANSVGIQSKFGKPKEASLSSGLHYIGPFTNIDKYNTRKQPLILKNAKIKFGTNGDGDVDATVYWRIDTSDKKRPQMLWRDWREFSNVKEQFVEPQTRSVLNAVVGSYPPEEAVNSQKQEEMQDKIKEALEKRFNNTGIAFDGVTLGAWTLGDKAQGRIDRITSARADLEKAKIDQQRATVEANTNRIRSQNANTESAQQRCLDILDNWDVRVNGPAPATFTCGFGSNTPVAVR